MPELDWTKDIEIPKGLPDGELERLNKIERGEHPSPSVGTEISLELPIDNPEIYRKDPKPEIDKEN